MPHSITLREVEQQGSATAEANRRFDQLREWLLSSSSKVHDLHDVEEKLETRAQELCRLLLQAHVDGRGDGDVGAAILAESRPAQRQELDEDEAVESAAEAEKENDGGELVRLTHKREREKEYLSTFGWIGIARKAMGKPGQVSVFPLDEELSLPKRGYGYPVQQRICTEVARGPYKEAGRALEKQGIKVALANLDDVVIAAACDFELFYLQRRVSSPDATSELLVAAVDCKGVPVKKPLGEKDGNGRDRDPTKDDDDASKRQGKKKMATVAAVYTIERYERTPEDVIGEVCAKRHLQMVRRRPRPEEKRVWASLVKSKDEVFFEIAEEMRLRDPEHRKTWLCLADGERALQLRALGKIEKVILVLDIFHVLERLWKVAHAFFPKRMKEKKARQDWVTEHLLMLLQGKVSLVVRGIRQAATKRDLGGKKRETVDEVTGYYMNNKEFMRYDEYLAAGYPIGSGAAEGACRVLIKDRLERTGMRWSIVGAEAVIQMRAIELCEDPDEYWVYHIAQEHQRLYDSRHWEIAS